jgi:hypothetical protein
MILIIRKLATKEQIAQMSEQFGSKFIKLAVDVNRKILAGGGELHSDCEQVLLEDGSQQVDVWGADWHLDTKTITFESLINIRPRQQNFGLEVQDSALRDKIEKIARKLMEAT